MSDRLFAFAFFSLTLREGSAFIVWLTAPSGNIGCFSAGKALYVVGFAKSCPLTYSSPSLYSPASLRPSLNVA